MKKKFLYCSFIILTMAIIYALASGVYFLFIYRSQKILSQTDISLDAIFNGYFYMINIIGILVVSLFMKKDYSKRRMFITYSVSLLSVILVAFILFLPLSTPVFILVLFLSFVLFGCTQGAYVFLLTIFCPKSNRCLSLGIGASLSVIINFLFSLVHNGAFVQSFSALIAYLILALISCALLAVTFRLPYFSDENDTDTEPFSPAGPKKWSAKAFLFTCIFIMLSWAIQSLGFSFPCNNSLILGLNNEILRVPNVLGLLIAGFLLDRRKKTGAVFSLILLATPMLYIIVQSQAGITLIIYLLSYTFTGFLSIYRFGIVANMSDSVDSKGNVMTYLCAFGMIFGRFGEGIGGLLGIRLQNDTLMLVTVASFLLVISVAFFIFHYLALYVPVPQVIKTHEDQMTAFRVKYKLSTREIEVLEFLIDGNSNAQIADKLYISENTVRFHVSNLLKKTNCKNRKEISILFHEE